MAFEGLSSRLQAITRKLGGKARITESDLKEVMREVKLALLEADVNYKIVRDEMTELLGGTLSKINFTPNPPTIIMLVGLQGSRKNNNSRKAC